MSAFACVMASGALAASALAPRLMTTWLGGAETMPVPVTSSVCNDDCESSGATVGDALATVGDALEPVTGEAEPQDIRATATELVRRAVSPRRIFPLGVPPVRR
jgi:hypothetical protein